MIDLAQLDAGTSHTQRAGVAARQGIPADYMDHILGKLREDGLIESIRGRGGGFRLGRKADEISVWDIFSAVEDGMVPVQCLEHMKGCGVEAVCSTKDAWTEIVEAVRSGLGAIRLSSLAERAHRVPEADSLVYESAAQECRAPRKGHVGGV
jgi:Rrf2 family protein